MMTRDVGPAQLAVAPSVQTASGRKFPLFAPSREDVLIVDIGHALSRIPRFNGHTIGAEPWTVAAHSLLVESLVPTAAEPGLRLAALLHDAHEAYIGDIISPLKSALATMGGKAALYALQVIEDGIDKAIRGAFGLPLVFSEGWREAIKLADLQALRIESLDVMALPREPWGPLPDHPDWIRGDVRLRRIAPMPRDDVQRMFYERFSELMQERRK